MKTSIEICMVAYNNHKQMTRLVSQIINMTDYRDDYQYSYTVFDNSDNLSETEKTKQIVRVLPNIMYKKHGNTQLADTMNQIVKQCDSDFIIYLCTNDTYIYDSVWLITMVEYMKKNSFVVMGGFIHDISYDTRAIAASDIYYHIQGGLYIVKTETLKKYPYTDKYPHAYMDVHWSSLSAGRNEELGSIPGVYSTMRLWSLKQHEENKISKKFKIVHALVLKDVE